MNVVERMSMEAEWQRRVERRPAGTTFEWINIGQNIVNDYNAVAEQGSRLNFVHCIEPDYTL